MRGMLSKVPVAFYVLCALGIVVWYDVNMGVVYALAAIILGAAAFLGIYLFSKKIEVEESENIVPVDKFNWEGLNVQLVKTHKQLRMERRQQHLKRRRHRA